MLYLSGGIIQVVTGFVLVVQADYWLLIAIILVSITFFTLFRFYQKSNLELKRLFSLLQSPVDAHVSESLAGLSTIKAHGLQRAFIAKQRELIDISNACGYIRFFLTVWIRIRLGVISSILSFLIVLASLLVNS